MKEHLFKIKNLNILLGEINDKGDAQTYMPGGVFQVCFSFYTAGKGQDLSNFLVLARRNTRELKSLVELIGSFLDEALN
jgi:hypothetical protein